MINILQTPKQMFCLMCEKYLCNLHYLDENRIHYSYHRNDKTSYLKSYRAMIQKSIGLNNSNSDILTQLIEEFNMNVDKKRINLRKIDLNLGNSIEISKNQIKEDVQDNTKGVNFICTSNCLIAKLKSNDSNLQLDITVDKIVEEYIQKLFLIHMFDPCQILLSLKNIFAKKKIILSCYEVRF